MKTKVLYIILFIVFVCDLVFIYFNKTSERFFTKTLLLPILILIYFLESKQNQNLTNKRLHDSTTLQLNNLFLSGFVISFFGDLFLLFKWGFLAGLGSFLTAHLFYIFCFKNLGKTKVSSIWLIFIGLYLFSLIYFLYPYLKEMKIPVIIYGIAISTMMYFSLKTSNTFLIFGALLFVVSDSVLAVSLFVKETLFLNLLVMITYVSAQFLLMKGVLREKSLVI